MWFSERKWTVVLKEYVLQSQNKDGKEQHDKYQCHPNWQWRVMCTFINISHWVIRISLNYSHSKLTPHKCVWCQLITCAHFMFCVTGLTKYCKWKFYQEKLLWSIHPRSDQAKKSLFLRNVPDIPSFIKTTILGWSQRVKHQESLKNPFCMLIHWISLCLLRFF